MQLSTGQDIQQTKLHGEPRRFRRASALQVLRGCGQFITVFVFAYLVWCALTSWSPVPIVDGWPVYHRLMNYLNGAIDLTAYLLSPHGAHLHSLIYALYLLDFDWGSRQLVPHLASVLSTVLTAGLLAYAVLAVAKPKIGPFAARSAGVLTLVVVATLSVEGLIPFQAVLTVSRLAYVAILFGFVRALVSMKWQLEIVLLVTSCVAVTFHGSGLIFAVVVLLQHLHLGRSWLFRAVGLLPLMASFSLNYFWLPHNDGEIHSAVRLLGDPSFRVLFNLILAGFAYYATPLNPLWGLTGESIPYSLVLVGAAVGTISTLWSIHVLSTLRSSPTAFYALSLAWIGVFLALSAMSAALSWEARKLAIPNLTTLSVALVMDATRYTIVSVIAWAIAILALLTQPGRARPIGVAVAVILVALLLVADSYALETRRRQIDASNLAGAGLLTGGSPVADEIEPWIWPRVRDDWFWPNELSKVVEFMKIRKVGIAYGLPSHRYPATGLGQARISNFKVNTTTMPGICALTGSIPRLPRDRLNRPQIIAVSDVNNTVLGYARLPVNPGSDFEGYLLCRDQDQSTYQLFVSTF